MIRPVSNLYVEINGQKIKVGKIICECDNAPWYLQKQTKITISEWEKMKSNFEIADQKIDDLAYHTIGSFKNNTVSVPIEQKWIDELTNLGYSIIKMNLSSKKNENSAELKNEEILEK